MHNTNLEKAQWILKLSIPCKSQHARGPSQNIRIICIGILVLIN